MHRSSQVVELLQELIRIPSVNPSIDPQSGTGEAAIAAFVQGWLEQHGVPARLEETAPGRPNAVGELGHSGGRSLALCAHLDTVATAGMTIPPFEPTLRDGRLYGRGSYDMKCGAAAVMVAAAELAERELRGRLLLALVADEEHASIGARHFVEHHPTDACILTEPSEGALILAHKGFLWAEILCSGRAAHGSRWDLGISAISKMGPILTRLTAFDAQELRSRTHELVGPASMHGALLHGGTGLSTYASECRLQIERRTLPSETNAAAFRELVDLVKSVDPEAEVRLLLERSPMVTPADCDIAHATRDAIREVCGRAAPETGVAYWMDAAIFSAAGIPTVNYGPAGAGAHEAEEWVDVQSVVNCAETLVRAAERYLGSG